MGSSSSSLPEHEQHDKANEREVNRDEDLFPLFAAKLNLLKVKTSENVASEIKQLQVLDDEEAMTILSDHIYNRALSDESSSLKYVELAKNLSDATIEKAGIGNDVSFKDVFLKVSIEKFEDLANGSFDMLHWNNEMAVFFGNLYAADMVSSALVSHWVASIPPELQTKMLETIKSKVKDALLRNSHDPYIASIGKLLMARNVMNIEQLTSIKER